MIQATSPVSAFDVKTGESISYDQWVPTRVIIDSPDDFSGANSNATMVEVTLCRCRTLPSGKTERLSEATARAIGCGDRLVTMTIPNIYADASDQAPFVQMDYPPDATSKQAALIDFHNTVARSNYNVSSVVYPITVRRTILSPPPTPKSVMEQVVAAAALLGQTRGVI